MKFIPAVEHVIINWKNYQGRAIRSEYWYWTLFVFLVGIVMRVLDIAVLGVDMHNPLAFHPLSMTWKLVTLIPGIMVGIRRMHDVNRSGWWLMLAFTIIGVIPLIYWACIRGTVGENRFGPDPLPSSPASAAPTA